MIDDSQLLHRFVNDSAQEAFTALVERHVNLVYSAALRQLGGDTHLAQDATQAVFLALAQNAPQLVRHTALTGWLYTATRFVAAKIVRQQHRRQLREQAAEVMHHILSETGAAPIDERDWEELRPILDAVMHELPNLDRDAILLRVFEGRSFAEVGAVYGITENAARMRVERALEKLRGRLARRGITSTAVALGATLATRTIVAAPAGLAATASASSTIALASLAPGAAVMLARSLLEFMSITKITLGVVGVAAAFGLGTYVGSRHAESAPATIAERRSQSSEMIALRAENGRLRNDLAAQHAESHESATPSTTSSGPSDQTGTLDRLRVLAELEKNKVAHTAITFVNAKGEITDAFASLFALTEPERAALQQAVNSARDRLADLERENTTVTRNIKGGVVIAVKPFPQTGGPVYDELTHSFENTLGPDRMSSYLTLGADQVEKALGNFGASERTVTFDYNPSSEREPYVLREQQKQPNANGKGTSTSTTVIDYKTFDQMAERAGTISKLVPPDFPRGK